MDLNENEDHKFILALIKLNLFIFALLLNTSTSICTNYATILLKFFLILVSIQYHERVYKFVKELFFFFSYMKLYL